MSWSLLGIKGLKSWISVMILLVTWKEGLKKNCNFFLRGEGWLQSNSFEALLRRFFCCFIQG